MRPSVDAPSSLTSPFEQSLTPAPLAVLDTNVVLDWLLFADIGVQALASAIEQGRLRWIATAEMRGEFDHVLRHGLASTHGGKLESFGLAWERHCFPHPTAPQAAAPLRCTDTDDQKFLDLALAAGARWLVSRDRALLKLRTKAAVHRLAIITPRQWRD
jgi:uncharacterized protein